MKKVKAKLPNCKDCPRKRPACSLGVCVILVDEKKWDLVELKKQEVENERR